MTDSTGAIDPTHIDPPSGVDALAWSYALAAARAYCGWHIAPVVSASVVLDARGSSVVRLPSLRVVEVSQVFSDGLPVEFEWSADGMIRRASARSGFGHRHDYFDASPRFSNRYRGVDVSFKHGFEHLPGELIGVLTEASARGVGSTVAQVGQVRYATDGMQSAPTFMMDQHRILDRYRLGPAA